MQYQLVLPTDPERRTVEHFICDRYWLNFNACLKQLPEHLLAVYDGEQLVAACGLQYASQRVLFSQAYLTRPLLSYRVNGISMPSLDTVTEVGSMAAVSTKYLAPLFAAVIEELAKQQQQIVLFTATRALRRRLQRLGIELTCLASADEQALPATMQSIWGSYYQHQPMVLAGWLTQGVGRLEQYLFERAEVGAC